LEIPRAKQGTSTIFYKSLKIISLSNENVNILSWSADYTLVQVVWEKRKTQIPVFLIMKNIFWFFKVYPNSRLHGLAKIAQKL